MKKKTQKRTGPVYRVITDEVFKNGGENMIIWLSSKYLQTIWISSTQCGQRKKFKMIRKEASSSILKNKGDQKVCSNYRSITLLSVPGKVLKKDLQKSAPSFIFR